MDEVICDHAHKCKRNYNVISSPEYCSGKIPHKYIEEQDKEFYCPHVNYESVKDVPT